MQVNNNYQSPNFGMALKIKPGAREYLAKQSQQTLNSLQEIGEKLAPFKHWDLEIDEKGLRLAGKGSLDGAYRDIGTVESKGAGYSDFITVKMKVDRFANKGETIDKYLAYANKEEAQAAYERIKQATPGLNRTVAVLEELETISARQAAKDAEEAAAQAKLNKTINSLFDKFGNGEPAI